MAEDKHRKLEAELEGVVSDLRDALEFINDDRHLTDEGVAAREVLREEVEAMKQDLEAVRQEHGWAPRSSPLDDLLEP